MLKNHPTSWVAATVVVMLAAMGCSKDARPVSSANDHPVDQSWQATASPKQQGDAVIIAPEVKKRCGIPATSDSPKFDFNSAVLKAGGLETLDALATCITAGPMRGDRLMLVGRADPRGPEAYNLSLGAERAEAVARHLRSRGVAAGSMTSQSRGELDALGYDEESWALDRRVDVALVDPGS